MVVVDTPDLGALVKGHFGALVSALESRPYLSEKYDFLKMKKSVLESRPDQHLLVNKVLNCFRKVSKFDFC